MPIVTYFKQWGTDFGSCPSTSIVVQSKGFSKNTRRYCLWWPRLGCRWRSFNVRPSPNRCCFNLVSQMSHQQDPTETEARPERESVCVSGSVCQPRNKQTHTACATPLRPRYVRTIHVIRRIPFITSLSRHVNFPWPYMCGHTHRPTHFRRTLFGLKYVDTPSNCWVFSCTHC